jgi:hypothetical protein
MFPSPITVFVLSVSVGTIIMAAQLAHEKDYLTTENISDVLHERLFKRSRTRCFDVVENISPFLFSSTNVTSNHNAEVNYNFQGPGNCKVFPGDSDWPSPWLWASFELVTLGALIEPVPISQTCYANETSGVNEAACAMLASNCNKPRFMYI